MNISSKKTFNQSTVLGQSPFFELYVKIGEFQLGTKKEDLKKKKNFIENKYIPRNTYNLKQITL